MTTNGLTKKMMFKVIIAGGRDFTDYDCLKVVCDYYLQNQNNIEIVSGVAKGADQLGEKYAKERGYSLKQFPAYWNKHGKRAGHIRNTQMAEYADALIAFWDQESRGTGDMIKQAKQNNLKIKVFKY